MKTIVRFKLFKINLDGSKLTFDCSIDPKIAQQNIIQERPITQKYQNDPNFRFLKVIPDELPLYFWDQESENAADLFISNLKQIDQKIYSEIEYIKVSDLLKDKKLCSIYDKVFKQVYDSNIDKKMFGLEVKRRMVYYSKKPFIKSRAEELAKKAFALFSAEIAVLYKLFPDLTILTRNDELDLYKYELYKVPKNRPNIPKLFVI